MLLVHGVVHLLGHTHEEDGGDDSDGQVRWCADIPICIFEK